ncbi:MAG: RNA polymerase sigma factor [Acidobacteriota bacterium]
MGTAASWVESYVSFGDNALVSAYLQGHEEAFEVLVYRYQDKLVNYLNNLLHDYEMAVDLGQEAFIRVFQNADRYRGKYQFSTWIYRIATNLAIDEIRRRRRKGRFFFYNVMSLFQKDDMAYPLPDSRESPEKSLDRKEKLQRLQAAIDSLPQKYRLAFMLKEAQELSYEETSRILNISLGTAKSRIHRAKMLLRGKLVDVL